MKRSVLVFILILTTVFITACGQKDKYTTVKPVDGIIKIDRNEVSDGKAHYFKAEAGGKDVKFFLLKSEDGVIRAAFDACDVCYKEKKGYSQDGNFMVCNNCGMRFHSSKINVVKGGCNPSPVYRKYDDKYVYLHIDHIEAGKWYF